jgi:CBS domain-containing protein
MSGTIHIPIDEAGPTVSDVMMRGAKTVGPATPLAEARAVFVSPRKMLLLVTDGERFLGTLTPGDVPPEGDGPIGPHVRADAPRVSPDDPVSRALEIVESEGIVRIPVVDEARPAAGPGLLQLLTRGVLHLPVGAR